MRQFSEAIQCYSEALTIDPDNQRIANRLAFLNELFKDENIAVKDEDEDRNEQRQDTEPGKRLSELENTGRLAEALKSLQELLARNPDDHQLQLQKGILSAKLSKAPSIAVCGLQSIWDRLTEILILPLLHHDNPIYHAAIVSTSRGILLYGPPGCGKTLTVSHLTHRAGITLLKITLAETLNLYVGESEKRLRQSFDEAIRRAKEGERILISMDEVDALGFARGGGPENEASWSRHLIGTLLGCFDEIQEYYNIAVVGATNDPFNVDMALRRPGRLGGTTLYVPPPNQTAREELFKLFTKDTPGHEDLEFSTLAGDTKWYSGDDIRMICRDVHFKVAARVVAGEQKEVHTSDYLAIIEKHKSSTLPWFLDLQRRLAEGQIDQTLLQADLEQDLKDFTHDFNSWDNPSFAIR